MGVLLGLTLAFFALLVVAIYVNNRHDSLRRQVSLTGYNYTDRPVHIFSVNGVMGGNIFRDGGGGKIACCAVIIIGQAVKIEWQPSRTAAEYDANVEPFGFKSTTAIVPPPQTPAAEYLEVHFYQDGHVELALVEFPGHRRIPYDGKD